MSCQLASALEGNQLHFGKVCPRVSAFARIWGDISNKGAGEELLGP